MGGLEEVLIRHFPQIIGGLSIIVISLVLAYVIKRSLQKVLSEFTWESGIDRLITGLLYYGIMVLGILTGLNTMGVKMGPLVAGLGLGGFALGFALRDAVSNFLAGVLILIYHPFHIGDHLSVSGCEGTVSEINLRYTILQVEGETLMIPNSVIFATPLRIRTVDSQTPREG